MKQDTKDKWFVNFLVGVVFLISCAVVYLGVSFKQLLVEYKQTKKNMELFDDSKMLFGEHKGKRMIDVPAKYLLWLEGELQKRKSKNEHLNPFEKATLNYCVEMHDALTLEEKGKNKAIKQPATVFPQNNRLLDEVE